MPQGFMAQEERRRRRRTKQDRNRARLVVALAMVGLAVIALAVIALAVTVAGTMVVVVMSHALVGGVVRHLRLLQLEYLTAVKADGRLRHLKRCTA
jgi:hypothetical protein